MKLFLFSTVAISVLTFFAIGELSNQLVTYSGSQQLVRVNR
jgi:hypothetical protein